MNKRISKKKSKEALFAALNTFRFVENGYHWTKMRFELNSGKCLLPKSKDYSMYIEARITYSIALYSLIGAPKLALSILTELNKLYPERTDIAAEMIECNLEVGDNECAKHLYNKFIERTKCEDLVREYKDYVNEMRQWEHYCVPGEFRNTIEEIMNGNIDKAIKVIHGEQSLESDLSLLYIEGVMNRKNEYLKQLSHILKLYTNIKRGFRFWFFRPNHIWNNKVYQKLIRHENFNKYDVILY